MDQNHKAYPKIAELTYSMVFNNCGYAARIAQGVADPKADIMRLLDEILGAEGVYHDDLKALDDWLAGLSKEDFDEVSDGEEGRVREILATVPALGDIEGSAHDFIDNIYEHCI